MRCRHPDLQLSENMRRECRNEVDPPTSFGGKQQRTEQNYIGGPERRETHVGESADQECSFGADEIRNSNEKRRWDRFLKPKQKEPNACFERRRRTK
jgi:hypothetical protein